MRIRRVLKNRKDWELNIFSQNITMFSTRQCKIARKLTESMTCYRDKVLHTTADVNYVANVRGCSVADFKIRF